MGYLDSIHALKTCAWALGTHGTATPQEQHALQAVEGLVTLLIAQTPPTQRITAPSAHDTVMPHSPELATSPLVRPSHEPEYDLTDGGSPALR